MKKMKRYLPILLAFALLMVAACGGKATKEVIVVTATPALTEVATAIPTEVPPTPTATIRDDAAYLLCYEDEVSALWSEAQIPLDSMVTALEQGNLEEAHSWSILWGVRLHEVREVWLSCPLPMNTHLSNSRLKALAGIEEWIIGADYALENWEESTSKRLWEEVSLHLAKGTQLLDEATEEVNIYQEGSQND